MSNSPDFTQCYSMDLEIYYEALNQTGSIPADVIDTILVDIADTVLISGDITGLLDFLAKAIEVL